MKENHDKNLFSQIHYNQVSVMFLSPSLVLDKFAHVGLLLTGPSLRHNPIIFVMVLVFHQIISPSLVSHIEIMIWKTLLKTYFTAKNLTTHSERKENNLTLTLSLPFTCRSFSRDFVVCLVQTYLLHGVSFKWVTRVNDVFGCKVG